jgi:hypothetical protein
MIKIKQNNITKKKMKQRGREREMGSKISEPLHL